MHVAYIALGSNLGDREANIRAAVDALKRESAIGTVHLSSLYETQAVAGPAGQPDFLNTAARVETTLDPFALFELMLKVEKSLGRERRERWGPRTIDLDLLLFDDQIITTSQLTIPHPAMHQRWFVLKPLVEVAETIL